MKQLILSVLILTFSLLSVDVTIYGDGSYKPYSYDDDGVSKGIYTEIIKKIDAKMDGYDIKVKMIPWKRGLKVIEDGTGFAIYPPYKHVEKRPYIWPYSEPILEEKVVVVGKKDVVEGKTNWPKDYYGLKIGENRGFKIGGDKFYQAIEDEKLVREESGGNDSNLRKLTMGRIDAYLNDELSSYWTLTNLVKDGKIKNSDEIITGAVVNSEMGYLGYSKKFESDWKQDFIEKFNKALIELKKTGEIEKMIQKYK
jgi:polar amino acid transport system substrate-binding protein